MAADSGSDALIGSSDGGCRPDGVTKCLPIIHKELDMTMALCDGTGIRRVNHRILLAAGDERAVLLPCRRSRRLCAVECGAKSARSCSRRSSLCFRSLSRVATRSIERLLCRRGGHHFGLPGSMGQRPV